MGDGSPSRFDQKGKGRAQQNGDVLALDLGSAEEGSGSQGAFMQMQMVEQQVRLLLPNPPPLLFSLNLRRTLISSPGQPQ
jgi:hypothetical protein